MPSPFSFNRPLIPPDPSCNRVTASHPDRFYHWDAGRRMQRSVDQRAQRDVQRGIAKPNVHPWHLGIDPPPEPIDRRHQRSPVRHATPAPACCCCRLGRGSGHTRRCCCCWRRATRQQRVHQGCTQMRAAVVALSVAVPAGCKPVARGVGFRKDGCNPLLLLRRWWGPVQTACSARGQGAARLSRLR